MSLRKNIQYVFIANIITIFFSAIVYPVILKIYHFDVSEFGIYQKYTSLTSIISAFIYFSLDITYISEKYIHKKDEKNYFFSLLLVVILIGTLIISVLIYLFKIKINIFYISLLVFSGGLFQIFIVLLKDEKELKKSSSILVQKNIINLLIIFIVGYYFRNYKIFLYGIIISNIYGIMKLYIFLKVKFIWNVMWIQKFIKNNLDKIYYKTFISILEKNSKEIPILLLLKYFGEQTMGVFNIGNKLLGLGNRILSSALSETFLSHMSKSKKEKEVILSNFKNLASLFFLIYVYVSVLSSYYLKYIIGEDYLKIAEIIRMISPLLYLEALVSPYINFFTIENKVKFETKINIFFCIFTIMIVYFFSKTTSFNNMILIYILIGCSRYLILSFFIFKKQNIISKEVLVVLFYIVNLFMTIKFYDILVFKYYIIVMSFMLLIYLLKKLKKY